MGWLLIGLLVLLALGGLSLVSSGRHVEQPWPELMPVAGVSYRQAAVRRCRVGDCLSMRLDPYGAQLSEYGGGVHDDPLAVLLLHEGTIVGYIPRVHNPAVHRALTRDGERSWVAVVRETVGGTNGYLAGLRIALVSVRWEPQGGTPQRATRGPEEPVPNYAVRPVRSLPPRDTRRDVDTEDDSLDPEVIWALNDYDEKHRPRYL